MDAISAIEAAITLRLAEPLQPLAVEPFPGDPAAYKLGSRKGAVLVVYRGSRLSKSQSTAAIAQERTLLFDLVVMVKDLRSHTGAYPVIQTLYRQLQGFKPAGAARVWIERDSFVEHEAGVWTYLVTVATRMLAIETQDGAPAPLLTVVNLEETHEQVPL